MFRLSEEQHQALPHHALLPPAHPGLFSSGLRSDGGLPGLPGEAGGRGEGESRGALPPPARAEMWAAQPSGARPGPHPDLRPGAQGALSHRQGEPEESQQTNC